MRMLVAGSCSPFSGREEIRWTMRLTEELKNKGIDVDSFMLPFVNNPLLIPEQMMALRLLDVENSCDLLLTVGYPAFVLKHRRKRALLFSLSSSLHEHFGSEYGVLSTPQYQRIQDAVHGAERKCLAEAERVLCASEALAAQIQNQYRLPTETVKLDGALHDANQTSIWEEDTWVVCESTLEPPDRIDLLLNAVTHSRGKWQLMFFVPSASEVYREALNQRIERLRLKERVLVRDSNCSLEGGLRKARLLVALPFATTRISESLLLATQSKIPVVTATDCGAVLEVIQNEKNGLVVEPSAEKIADALDRLVSNVELHDRLSRGYARSSRNAIPMENLITSLVE